MTQEVISVYYRKCNTCLIYIVFDHRRKYKADASELQEYRPHTNIITLNVKLMSLNKIVFCD